MSFLKTEIDVKDLLLALPQLFHDIVGDCFARFRVNSVSNTELVSVVVDALGCLPWSKGLVIEVEIEEFENSTYPFKLVVGVEQTQIEVLLDKQMIDQLEQIANLEHPDLFGEMEAMIEDGIQVTVLEKIKSITSFSEPILN